MTYYNGHIYRGKTNLYRHWDKDGKLLYVGISLSAIQRLAQHRDKGSEWFDSIAEITIETYETRAEAMSAEYAAITTEFPIHNIAHRSMVSEKEYKTATRINPQMANDEIKKLKSQIRSLQFKNANLEKSCNRLESANEIFKKQVKFLTDDSSYWKARCEELKQIKTVTKIEKVIEKVYISYPTVSERVEPVTHNDVSIFQKIKNFFRK